MFSASDSIFASVPPCAMHRLRAVSQSVLSVKSCHNNGFMSGKMQNLDFSPGNILIRRQSNQLGMCWRSLGYIETDWLLRKILADI